MGPVALPFLVLPTIAAAVVAGLLTDWRLAGAAATGSAALLIVLTAWSPPLGPFLLPILSGAAVGSLAALALLRVSPDPTVWSRLTAGMLTGFATHFVFLHMIAGPA